jgi:hypothetical protein
MRLLDRLVGALATALWGHPRPILLPVPWGGGSPPMPTRPLSLHRKTIEAALGKVSAQHAFAFAAACAERLWPVYERAAEGKPWAMQAVLRSSLDAVWDWLMGQRERPRLAEQCERAVFDANSDAEEDNGAFQAANSVYGLAAIVEQDQPHYSAQSAVSNLDLLDAFLYDLLDLTVSPENDLIVDGHELMQREMQRQLADLSLLSQLVGPDLVQTLRDRARGQSVLGDYWYRP